MRFSEFVNVVANPDGSISRPDAPQDNAQGLEAGPPYPREDMEAVRALQTRLEELGYSVGSTGVDGKYGPRTQRAVNAYKRDFNVQNTDRGRTISAIEIQQMQRAEAKDNPTPTGNEGGGAGDNALGGQPGSLEGTNVLAANRNPDALPNQNIIDALDRAASALGIQVQITPEGGRAGRETGTRNHPRGEAADIQIVRNGSILRPAQAGSLYDDLIRELVTDAARRGVRPGIGGYNWGIHYDESSWRQGRSDTIAGTWGSNFIQRGIQAAARELA